MANPYDLTIVIDYGTGNTGLTLSAQLHDTNGSLVGSAVTAGFVEVGSGQYTWTGEIPDTSFAGYAVITSGALRFTKAINPADAGDICEIGAGAVEVDTDYGGSNALQYTDADGNGIEGASIRIYLTVDYDANYRDRAYVKAFAYTDANGRWVRSVMLDPDDYTLMYYKTNIYGPDTKEITVS